MDLTIRMVQHKEPLADSVGGPANAATMTFAAMYHECVASPDLTTGVATMLGYFNVRIAKDLQ
jgi:hypothetical protein